MNNDSRGFVSRISSFTAQPFASGMDATGWILFLGLIVIAAWGWSRVLNLVTSQLKG